MNLRFYERILLAAVLALGLCATGCFRFGSNGPTSTIPPPPTNIMVFQGPGGSGRGPGIDKPNIGGVFPAVGRVVTENDLKQIGVYYHNALSVGQPPASVDDLGLKTEAPKLYQAIVDKQIIIYWRANPLTATAGSSNTVLGYDADVPTKGGAVLMLDGSARKMTAEEFKAAAKGG